MNRLANQPILQTALLADLDRYAKALESSVGAAGTMSAEAVPHSPWGESIQSLGMTLDMPVRELWAGQSQGGGGPLPAYEIGKKLTARPLTKPAASASGNAPAPKPEPKFPGRDGDFGDYVEWADFYRNLKAKFPGIDANFDEIKKYARDLLIEQGLKYLGDELKDYASDTLADWLSNSMTNAVSTAAASTAGGMMDGILGKIDEAFGKIGDLIQNPSKILDLAVAEGLPKLLDKGIDALFGIDADDSPGMVVGKYFGKMIVEGMVDALMAGVQNLDQLIANFQDLQARLKSMLDQFFNGTPGKAILPVARVDDKDDKVDVVLGNLPTVIARGQPVARATDLMTPSNKPITEGSATVFAGGLPLSRLTSATAIPSAIAKGEPTVLVGGPTVVIAPPPPPVTPPNTGGSSTGAPTKPKSSPGGVSQSKPTNDKSGAKRQTNDANQTNAAGDQNQTNATDAPPNDSESSGDGPSCSVQEAAKQLAPLAKDAYSESPEAPAGWTLMDRVDGRLGFNASIYEGEFQGRNTIVVAYGGTAGAMDGVSDVVNGLWGSDQYVQAVGLASAIRQQYPDANIVFTGHSLGGGMASFAGIMTNTPAIGFNAAGPLPPALLTFGAGNLAGLTNTSQASQHIIHVNAENDPLTNSVAGYPWSSNVYTVPLPKPPSENGVFQNLIYNHSIDNLNDALQNGAQLHPQKPDQLTSSGPGMSFHMDPKDAPPGTLMQPGQSNSPPVGGFLVDPVTGQIIYG
ncbi:MAG: PAAR domain-containing protein [Planctomycetia bacterium]|nr:PAAR domain-containing protein [Planctomycetia bacterium]